MPTLVRNLTRYAFALPRPLMGVLPPGQGVVVPHTVAELASCMSELAGACDVRELADAPVDMRFVAAWPWREAFGLDGLSPPSFSLTLAPAGHAPGYYFVNRLMMKRVAATAGNLALSVTWHDPRGLNQNFQNAVLSLVSAGPIPLGQGLTINSSGQEPVILAGTFSGVTGPLILDASGQLELSQRT